MKKINVSFLIFILLLNVSVLFGQSGKRHRVIVTTAPKGAEVLVKGTFVGRTPYGFWAPAGARFSLEVRKSGYQTWRRDLTANRDHVFEIVLRTEEETSDETLFEAVQHPLVIHSLPEEANVWINGEMLGQTPFRMPVDEGSQLNIIVTKDGYQEWIRNMTVSGSIRETVQLQQIKKSNMKYWLIPGFALISYGLIQYFRSDDEPESTETPNVWPTPPARP